MDKLRLYIKILGLLLFSALGVAQENYLYLTQLPCSNDSTLVSIDASQKVQNWESDQPFVFKGDALAFVPSGEGDFTLTGSFETYGNNLISNGNFELGNTGFATTYTFSDTITAQGEYNVVNNPETLSSYFLALKDHTSGNGNMFVADGDVNQDIFYQSTVSVTPDQTYELSFWVRGIHEDLVNPNAIPEDLMPPVFEVFINDDLTHTYELPMDTLWHQIKLKLNAESDTMQIGVKDVKGSKKGNDFAFDDIELRTYDLITESITILPCPTTSPEVLVFTPNGDGLDDEFFIATPGEAKIIDLSGKVIRTLQTPAYWDGRDENGLLMSTGYYAIVINENQYLRVSLVR